MSSYLCTFNTLFGRYRSTRLPFGVCSAPEVFQKKSEALFSDIDGVELIFGGIILAAQDEQEHDKIMKELLDRAKVKNVKFNPDKLQYKVKEVNYMGNIVSESSLIAKKYVQYSTCPYLSQKKNCEDFLEW